jgi:hypothetical protein
MPLLTSEQKRALLQKHGYNPDTTYYDEVNDIVIPMESQDVAPPASASAPSIQQNVQAVENDKYSTIETVGRNAAMSAIPTAAGIWGGVKLGALGGSAFGPVGTVLGGLGGAVIGGAGASYLQSKVIPEEFQQKAEEARQEDPIAGWIGRTIPGIAAVNPIKSLQQVAQLPTIANRLIKDGALSAAERNILANTAKGAGTGAGMNVVQQNLDDQPFSWGEFLADTITSGALNEPNKIGRALGMTPTVELPKTPTQNTVLTQEDLIKLGQAQADAANRDTSINRMGDVGPVRTTGEHVVDPNSVRSPERMNSTIEYYNNSELAQLERLANRGVKDPKDKIKLGPEHFPVNDYPSEFAPKAKVEEPMAYAKSVGEGNRPVKDAADSATVIEEAYRQNPARDSGNTILDKEAQKNLLHEQKIKDRITAAEEASRLHAEEVAHIEELRAKKALLEAQKQREALELQAKEVESIKTEQLKYQESLNREATTQKVKQDIINKPLPDLPSENKPLDLRQLNAKMRDNQIPGGQYSEGTSIKADEDITNLPPDDPRLYKNQPLVKDFQIKAANRRGFNVEETPVIPGNKDAQGLAPDDTRTGRYTGDKATADTLPHEFEGHGNLRDLKNSKDKSDNKLYEEALAYGKKLAKDGHDKEHADLLRSKGRDEDYIAEELLVRALSKEGFERARKLVYGKKREKFDQWWKDVKTNLKRKLNISKDEDVIAYLDSRYHNDAPHGTIGTEGDIKGNVKTSGEVESKKEESKKVESKLTEVPVAFRDLPYSEGSSLSKEDVTKEPRHGFFKMFSAAFDRVKNVGENGEKLSRALHDFSTRKQDYEATISKVPVQDIMKLSPSMDELRQAFNYTRDMYRYKKSSIVPTERLQQIVDIVKPAMKFARKTQNDLGLKVEDKWGRLRAGTESEFYISDMLNDKAIDLFANRVSSNAYDKALDEWAQYVHTESGRIVSVKEARENIETYVKALGRKRITSSTEFNALRKAAGYGIPESLREDNLLKILQKYGRRASTDLAFFQELQSKPEIAKALGIKDQENNEYKVDVKDVSGDIEVERALKFVYNDFTAATEHPRINSAIRAMSNSLLGIGTAVRNTVQLPSLVSPYIQSFKDIKALMGASTKLSKYTRESLEAGARSGFTGWRVDPYEMLNKTDGVVYAFDYLAAAMRKYQGRELMEQGDRILSYGIGRELAELRLQDAKGGDTKALEWLKKFGNTVELDDLGKIGDKELRRIATNFSDRIQGTYDGRGLPAGAFDSQFAPFFSLSRWGIERSNIIWNDVIKPMQKGNYLPIITYALGTLVTGVAIRKLNEAMSGKKDYTPSFAEASAEENKAYQVAAVINLLQMGSAAGIIFDIAKVGSDAFIQNEAPRGPINFPLADFLTEELGRNISDWSAAISNGSDPVDTTIAMLGEILKGSVQSYRMLNTKVLDTETTERQNRFRDYRTFKKLEGEEVPSLSSFRSNKFENPEEKEFKRTDDPEKAIELAERLFEKAVKDAKGDPYKLIAKLKALKANSYQTMPNPENFPLSFQKYFEYLQKTQGDERANQYVQDYIMQNAFNKVKSEMLPSFSLD